MILLRIKAAFIFLFCSIFLVICSLGLKYSISSDFDLYKNGRITSGIVESREQTTRTRGRRYRRRIETVYVHQVKYKGLKKEFTKKKPIPVGSRIEIYYSTKNHNNAVFLNKNLPYRSIFPVLWNNLFMVFMVVPLAIISFGSLMTLIFGKEKTRRQKYFKKIENHICKKDRKFLNLVLKVENRLLEGEDPNFMERLLLGSTQDKTSKEIIKEADSIYLNYTRFFGEEIFFKINEVTKNFVKYNRFTTNILISEYKLTPKSLAFLLSYIALNSVDDDDDDGILKPNDTFDKKIGAAQSFFKSKLTKLTDQEEIFNKVNLVFRLYGESKNAA